MNTQTKTPPVTFAEAFVKLQCAIKPAIKDATNPAFRSKYADLSAVWEAVRAPLAENGFGVIQAPQFEGDVMFLETTLLHASGDKLVSRYPLRPVKQDPQGFGSAITYAKRYALSAMLGVVADEDDDGNAASGVNSNGHKQPAPAQAAPIANDQDVEDGVRNWTALRRTEIDEATRIPELYQWKDLHEQALARLKAKHKSAHDSLMQYYQAKFERLSKREAAE